MTTKQKTFWQKPEGVTGIIFLVGLVIGGGFLLSTIVPTLALLLENAVNLSIFLMSIAAIAYVIINPRMRNLIWYMYKSLMRWVTGLFVQLDPIAILKAYVEELKDNLRKMNKQIGKLRGQMHKLKEIIVNNERAIEDNIQLASKAKDNNKRDVMILKSRKAGRLKESNMRLGDLYKKMEVMYRVLTRMYENSAILMEDVQDQVAVKEQERKAIHASHSAMKSARSIISGDPDRRAMFDTAMEAVADDVAGKVGEMERFMEMSSSFMDSIDLQNGIFEEEGLRMLEEWEQKGASLILGDEKGTLLLEANDDTMVLDLNQPVKTPVRSAAHKNQYDNFFE